jgi:GWxTD domain-containing protein
MKIIRNIIVVLTAAGLLLASCAIKSDYGHLPPRKQVEYRTLRYIMTEAEQFEYLSLETETQRDDWTRKFWLRRDPTPGTPENERKLEHERRVKYALANFTTHGRRNGWWVDKGRIYIKFGEPELIMRGQIGNTFRLGWEMWVYYRVEFRDFLKETIIEPQDLFETDMQKYTYSFAFDRENRIAAMTHAGVISTFSNESYRENLRYLPVDIFRLSTDELSASVDYGIFRSASGTPLIEIWYELPEASFEPRVSGADSIPDIEVTAMLIDTTFSVITQETVRETSRVFDWGRGRSVLGTFYIWPEELGRYDLQVNLHDITSENRTYQTQPLTIDELQAGSVGLSSIEFALPAPEGTAGEQFSKGDYRIVPNPSRTYYRTEPLFFYFEAYGFGAESEAEVHCDIGYRITSRSDLLVPSEFNESVTADVGVWAHTAKLDISKLPYDEYELEIRVSSDRGEEALAKKKFKVVGWDVY